MRIFYRFVVAFSIICAFPFWLFIVIFQGRRKLGRVLERTGRDIYRVAQNVDK